MLTSKQKGSFSLVPTVIHLLVEPQRQPLIFFLHKQCRTNKSPQKILYLHLCLVLAFHPNCNVFCFPIDFMHYQAKFPQRNVKRAEAGKEGKSVEWPWLPQKATHLQQRVTSFQAYKDTLPGKNTQTSLHLPDFHYSTLHLTQGVEILLEA